MLIVGISLSAARILIDSMTSLLSEADRRAEIERGLAPGGAKPHERGLSHFSGCISDTEVSMSSDSVVLVGLDVHKDSIMVAYSVGFGDVENLGKISPRATDIDRLCKRVASETARGVFVYEGG